MGLLVAVEFAFGLLLAIDGINRLQGRGVEWLDGF
jgi:hypothetical protein